MIKAAVFDLDHTLFDRYATLTALTPNLRKKLKINKDLSDSQVAELLIDGDKKYNHSGWENVHKYLIDQNLFEEIPSFAEYRDSLLGEFRNFAVPYDFTNPMLEELRSSGLKTGLLTNGGSNTQRKKIEMLELGPYFDEIIVSGEFGIDKPDPAPFLAIADKLGFNPQEIIYVGDNPLNDIQGARNANFIPVWVATFGWWTFPEIEKTKYWVNNVSELPKLIQKINKDLLETKNEK